MSLNFNEKGRGYEFFAQKGDTSDFGTLSVVSQSALTTFEAEIIKLWSGEGENEKQRLDGLYACLERFRSCLYYSRQISKHQDSLCSIHIEKSAAVSVSAEEACIDFESFLFHGRAALDRLTLHVNREHGGNSDRYSKLTNVLKNSSKGGRAAEMLSYIEACNEHFNELLIDGLDGEKSLRSRQIHRASALESTETNFSVYCHPIRGEIRFDHYFLGFPLVNTTWNLTKWLGYLILNAIAIYLPSDKRLENRHCRPIWLPAVIPFREYEVKKGGETVTVFKLTSSGFSIKNRIINRSAFRHVNRFKT